MTPWTFLRVRMGGVLRGALIVAAALSCLFTAFLVGVKTSPKRPVDGSIDALHELALDPKPESELRAAALQSAINATGDEYAHYLSPAQYQAFRQAEVGHFVGIGIQSSFDDFALVAVVDRRGPADRAGVKIGDRIVAIDGDAAKVKTVTRFSEALLGAAGTKVTVRVQRGNEQRDFVITRAKRVVGKVTHEMLGDHVALLRIPHFTENTADQTRAAINAVVANHARAIVVDLQDDPGGELEQAALAAQLFIGPGRMMTLATRTESREVSYEKPALTKLPLAVLVDGNTASAAELFALAIRDRHRGEIIGVHTYGKNRAQLTLPVGDGSAIFFTATYWLGPKGSSIYKTGVAPTIEVTDPAQRLPRALAALAS